LINILWNFVVYRSKITDSDELKKHVWSMSGRSLTSRLLMPLSASGLVT